MAITKIHPIKTTLSLSIDYICDSAKTDDEILISSYKCGYKTAALQFQSTKEIANSSSKNLARHLIQAFMPEEVTADTAHQIGQALCENHLKGKYEYVLTTHVDKGHIHNHIIFNNVSFVDGKAYASNKISYHQIRALSDKLCTKNGLSIVTESISSQSKTKIKGTSYKEYNERKRGNSYKAKLQYAIDVAIKSAKDWEHFLKVLRDSGYEINHGKHISFRNIGQERFTRSKSIGEDYTEERIKARIESKVKTIRYNSSKKSRSSSDIVDITSHSLAIKSAGFARWLKLQNLKNMARSWNEMTDNSITDIDTFNKYIANVHDVLGETQNELKGIELEIQTLDEKIKNINTYNKYRNIHTGYERSSDKDAYLHLNEREIILFDAAQESLRREPISPVLLSSIPKLSNSIYTLMGKAQRLSKELSNQKHELQRLNRLRINLETYLKTEAHLNNEKVH